MARVIALLTLALMVAACESNQMTSFDTRPVSIVQSHEGDDAGLPGPDVMVVNSAEQLAALGSESLATHNIDFSNHSLIVVTLGEKPTGGYSVRINGVQVSDDTLYIQGIETQPAADAIVTQALTHPYAAVEVPKLAEGLQIQSAIEEVTAGR